MAPSKPKTQPTAASFTPEVRMSASTPDRWQPKRHTDSHLLHPRGNREGYDAVNAEYRQHHRRNGKAGDKNSIKPARRLC